MPYSLISPYKSHLMYVKYVSLFTLKYLLVLVNGFQFNATCPPSRVLYQDDFLYLSQPLIHTNLIDLKDPPIIKMIGGRLPLFLWQPIINSFSDSLACDCCRLHPSPSPLLHSHCVHSAPICYRLVLTGRLTLLTCTLTLLLYRRVS